VDALMKENADLKAKEANYVFQIELMKSQTNESALKYSQVQNELEKRLKEAELKNAELIESREKDALKIAELTESLQEKEHELSLKHFDV
jgi:energy-coupling factor transporter ATP-binding protein EcfA2